MMKDCIRCAVEQPIEQFDKHPDMTDGHINVCKRCRHDYCKAWRLKNRIALTAKKAAYHAKTKKEVNAKRAKERKLNPSKFKANNLLSKFGMTLDQYDKMLESQGHACAICKQAETVLSHQTKKPFMLSVDHCHKTGKIRGLLCSHCNHALGKFRDDPVLLRAAAQYLEAGN